MGLEPEWVIIEWAGTLPGLKAGRWDMVCSGVGMSAERMTSPEFKMSVGTRQGGGGVFARADDDRFETFDDLCGKTMGAVRGAWYQDWLVGNLDCDFAEIQEYPGRTESFLALKDGRVDFTVGGRDRPPEELEEFGIKVVLPVFNPVPYGVAIRNEAPTLLQWTNYYIAEFDKSGQLAEWQTKWFGGPRPVGGE
jgi:ABC-type amino acid transport substrate-binding protein